MAELAGYTHWGWIDIDCLFGNLDPLLQHLRQYDVVAYPGGVGPPRPRTTADPAQTQPVVMLSGQLTVMRNIEYFRKYLGAPPRAITAPRSRSAGATYVAQSTGSTVRLGLLYQEAGHLCVLPSVTHAHPATASWTRRTRCGLPCGTRPSAC